MRAFESSIAPPASITGCAREPVFFPDPTDSHTVSHSHTDMEVCAQHWLRGGSVPAEQHGAGHVHGRQRAHAFQRPQPGCRKPGAPGLPADTVRDSRMMRSLGVDVVGFHSGRGRGLGSGACARLFWWLKHLALLFRSNFDMTICT